MKIQGEGFREEAWFQWHTPDQQKVIVENTLAGKERDSFVDSARNSELGVPSSVVEALDALQTEPTIRLKAAIGDSSKLANFRKNPDAVRRAAYLIDEIRNEWEQSLTGETSAEILAQRDKSIDEKIAEIKSMTEYKM